LRGFLFLYEGDFQSKKFAPIKFPYFIPGAFIRSGRLYFMLVLFFVLIAVFLLLMLLLMFEEALSGLLTTILATISLVFRGLAVRHSDCDRRGLRRGLAPN
jgi:hypothetical protein